MRQNLLALGLFAMILAGCGGDEPEQTTGLFDASGPGGQGGAGAGTGSDEGGMGGAGSSTSTNTEPLTFEEALQAECEGGCHHAAEVSKMEGCQTSPTCVQDCVDYGMYVEYGLRPPTTKCGDEYLAILKCAQLEDTTETCYCGSDGTLACQVCAQENTNFENCLGFSF